MEICLKSRHILREAMDCLIMKRFSLDLRFSPFHPKFRTWQGRRMKFGTIFWSNSIFFPMQPPT